MASPGIRGTVDYLLNNQNFKQDKIRQAKLDTNGNAGIACACIIPIAVSFIAILAVSLSAWNMPHSQLAFILPNASIGGAFALALIPGGFFIHQARKARAEVNRLKSCSADSFQQERAATIKDQRTQVERWLTSENERIDQIKKTTNYSQLVTLSLQETTAS